MYSTAAAIGPIYDNLADAQPTCVLMYEYSSNELVFPAAEAATQTNDILRTVSRHAQSQVRHKMRVQAQYRIVLSTSTWMCMTKISLGGGSPEKHNPEWIAISFRLGQL